MTGSVALARSSRRAGALAVSARSTRRGLVAIVVFVVVWELGARAKQWFGVELPWIGRVPPPSAVLRVWAGLLVDPGYWPRWGASLARVPCGCAAAMAIGIPLGLALAVNRVFRWIAFPVIEVLRPIPPLAWVPASIIFWPTQELSITFVTFVGAFFTIVL